MDKSASNLSSATDGKSFAEHASQISEQLVSARKAAAALDGFPSSPAKLGADWLVGPIFGRSVKRADGDASVAMPIYEGGFAAIEPELVVELGNTRDEDRIFIGAEIASSPVPDINGYGPTAVVSDFGRSVDLD